MQQMFMTYYINIWFVPTRSISHTTNPKNQHFATTTLKFGLAKFSVTISYVCRHPAGPRHLAPIQQDRATDTGNQQLRHVTHIWDQNLRAQQYIILRRSHGQVTKVPGQASRITTEYSLLWKETYWLIHSSFSIITPEFTENRRHFLTKVWEKILTTSFRCTSRGRHNSFFSSSDRRIGFTKEYILVIEERLWVNIGEKKFALILFRCNFVEVRVNANVVIPENLVVVH